MNRLIIIGNGFDLAHGLPTSYCDFINNFWERVSSNYLSELFKNIIYIDESYDGMINYEKVTQNYNDFKLNLKSYSEEYNYIYSEKKETCHVPQYSGSKIIFEFKNNFFKIITNKSSIQNWVDVENEYYKLLKESLHEDDNSRVKLLNREFEDVKMLLELYLKECVDNKFILDYESAKEMLDIFQSVPIRGLRLENFYKELSKKDSEFFKKEILQIRRNLSVEEKKNYVQEINFENHFLSFNYTFTCKTYMQLLGINPLNLNEIHGSLFDDKNHINFGFGDEMDRHYQEIEEKDDNEYLKNIKSFQYLHTQNYKRLLDLIDSEKFQVYIMGHSCGLSDRILLNTIFEHENCISIKVFYHQRNDGSNNYTEITQNISRHFNKKKLMREKIVNRTLCQPLPQTTLTEK